MALIQYNIKLFVSFFMTWTRLFWVRNVQKAFARVNPGRPRQQLAISARYQAEIRKLFRVNGVPWLYNIQKKVFPNPRDKKPKTRKRQAVRELRLQKIQKALQQSQQKIIEFRQQRLNGRPLGGMDRLIAKTMPGWIKHDDSEKKAHKRKQREEQ